MEHRDHITVTNFAHLPMDSTDLRTRHKFAHRKATEGHDDARVDRFNLVIDVIDRVPSLRTKAAHLKEQMKNEIILNLRYAREQGTDRAEIANWVWPY